MPRGPALLVTALALAAAVACSSRPKPDTTGSGAGTGTAATPAPVDAGAGEPAAPAALTRAECEQLVDHVLRVGLDEMKATRPADEVPTDEQIAKKRAVLLDEMLDACLAWDRPSFECMMTATATDALYACAGP